MNQFSLMGGRMSPPMRFGLEGLNFNGAPVSSIPEQPRQFGLHGLNSFNGQSYGGGRPYEGMGGGGMNPMMALNLMGMGQKMMETPQPQMKPFMPVSWGPSGYNPQTAREILSRLYSRGGGGGY